jgi:hypothetical protein
MSSTNCNDVFLLLRRSYPYWFDAVQPLVLRKGCLNYVEYCCFLSVYYAKYVKSLVRKQKIIKQQSLADLVICQKFLQEHNPQLYDNFFDKDGNEKDIPAL